MENFLFSLNNVAPVFLIVFLGFAIRQTHIIDKNFSSVTSRFVFNVTLPALIFTKLVRTDFYQTFNGRQVLIAICATIVTFLIIWFTSLIFTKTGKDRGVFIQGSFRGNFAIVGFALIQNLFGDAALSQAALLLAFVMPLYNILAVIALTVPLHAERNIPLKPLLLGVFTNPLIIAAIIAIPWSLARFPLPGFMMVSFDYLAAVSLPLALVGIGAVLDFHAIKSGLGLAFSASIIKIIVIPIVLTWASYACGIRGIDLGILFILYAVPTAIASYIMAEAMGGNRDLAANIILISTLGSLVTIAVGIFLLRTIGII